METIFFVAETQRLQEVLSLLTHSSSRAYGKLSLLGQGKITNNNDHRIMLQTEGNDLKHAR